MDYRLGELEEISVRRRAAPRAARAPSRPRTATGARRRHLASPTLWLRCEREAPGVPHRQALHMAAACLLHARVWAR